MGPLWPLYRALQEAIRQLQQRRADLAAEEERSQASPEEQREALMAKVDGDLLFRTVVAMAAHLESQYMHSHAPVLLFAQ